jgi:acetyltransferase-like isoleucine patch superfamily enzyme
MPDRARWSGDMLTWLKGLRLLRHPEVIRYLGRKRQHLQSVDSIRSKHASAKIDDGIELSGFALERLNLGERVIIAAGTILAFGDELNGEGTIRIGDRTWIGQYNNLRAGGGEIRIGADCLISQYCTLVASNHSMTRGEPIKSQPPDGKRRGVVLGDDVWLGAGVTVLPGIHVGQGAVIGAGSVVTNDVPAYEVWAGSPARKIAVRT